MNARRNRHRGRRSIAPVFLAAAVLLVASVALAYWAGLLVLASNRKLLTQRSVLQHLDQVLATLTDAETGQRGYLLTGEDRYLDPYRLAVAAIEGELQSLEDCVSTGDLYRDEVDRIHDLVQRKLRETAETINLRRDRGPEAALAIVRGGEGQRIMDALRCQVATTKAQEETEWEDAARQVHSSTRLRTAVFVLATALNLAFLAWAYRRIRGEIERRVAAEALAAGEDRVRLLVEAVKDYAILMLDREGRVVTWNPGAERIKGYVAGEIVGQHFSRFYTDEDRAADRPQRDLAVADEQGQCADEAWRVRKDGSRFWASVTITAMRDSAGQLLGFAKVTRDMTERKQVEEALRQSAKLGELVQLLDLASVLVRGRDDRIIRWNTGCRRIYGFTSEEALGQVGHELLRTRFPQSPEAIRATLLQTGRWEGELVHTAADGREVVVASEWVLWRDAAGEPAAILEADADITERTAAEEQLRQNEQRLRTILDALPVAVFLSDPAGNVVFTNAADDRIWGMRTHVSRDRYGEYKGRWLDTGKPVEPDQWALARTLETGEASVNDLVEIDAAAGGRKLLHNFALPIRGEGGRLLGAVVVTEDVTQRIQSQEQIRIAKEAAEHTAAELDRSNKDLEQFAYVASHDLQEPLRMVTGYLQLLSERYKGQLDDKADKYIAYAVDGATRMSTLIHDLLAYSRVNTRGEPLRPVSSEEAFDFAMRNLGSAIQQGGARVTHDPLPEVRADKVQLVQLFQNLVGNALKFRAPDREPRVHVSVCQSDGEWLFRVEDNGIGFEQQYEEKMFLIFQRLHSRGKYPGTGIGLAICKRIADRHGGRIWATGQPGQGATFSFTIPMQG